MKFLANIFKRKTPQSVCVRAYELLLREFPVDEVVERLKESGFSEAMAARAVVFLPSAFARAHYEREGFSFPESFYPGADAFRNGRTLRFIDEPIFQAALLLARQLKRDGDSSQVWRFIEISAEHKGIVEARSRGLTPVESSTIIYEF